MSNLGMCQETMTESHSRDGVEKLIETIESQAAPALHKEGTAVTLPDTLAIGFLALGAWNLRSTHEARKSAAVDAEDQSRTTAGEPDASAAGDSAVDQHPDGYEVGKAR